MSKLTKVIAIIMVAVIVILIGLNVFFAVRLSSVKQDNETLILEKENLISENENLTVKNENLTNKNKNLTNTISDLNDDVEKMTKNIIPSLEVLFGLQKEQLHLFNQIWLLLR